MWFTFKGSIWEPTERQWWVTGFNPSYFGNVDASKQVMICSVDFSQYTDSTGNNEMYKMLKNTADVTNLEYYNKSVQDYLIFDDDNCIVWICWYGDV